MRIFILAAVLGLLSGCGHVIPAHHQSVQLTDLRDGSFRIDPEHAVVLWKVDHLGFSTFVGRFNSFDGSLTFDPADPNGAQLDVIVETASIDANNPLFEDTLRGPSWFDVGDHPQARFQAQSIEILDDDTGRVTGDFTLLGVTRPLTLDVTFNGGATNFISGRYTMGFAARGSFLRSDYGMTTLVPAVGDEVELEIHAEFIRTQQADASGS